MQYEYDYLVFIGRFEPWHHGHLTVVQKALEMSKKVIILCGSAEQPRCTRNPFTFHERREMIEGCFDLPERERLRIKPLVNCSNDTAWIKLVQETVDCCITEDEPKIGLIGHSKDQSSYYLELFPQWDSVEVENVRKLNATDIRKNLFDTVNLHSWVFEDTCPISTIDALVEFKKSENYKKLQEEYDFIKNYKNSWKAAPWAPTFVTVDAVVVQAGHILLIQRKDAPGKGLFALPGGFINQDEKLIDGCIRELKEETKLRIAEPVLRGSIKRSEVFDDPNRSTRGRTITHAYLIELNNAYDLPKVAGGDDAEKAFWLPLSHLSSFDMYEDHYLIIQKMLEI